jgi:hypothetical protein
MCAGVGCLRGLLVMITALSILGCTQDAADPEGGMSGETALDGAVPTDAMSTADGNSGSGLCQQLSRGLCIDSPNCTLESTPETGVYRCRPANGACEQSIAQNDLEACRAIDGCRPLDGNCYCACRGAGRTAVEDGEEAGECVCACGDGDPPSCQAVAPLTCEELSRGLCMDSSDCTLENIPETGVYRCRPAMGACEQGIAQDDVDACRAMDGCRPLDGNCYCPCRGAGRTAVEDGSEADDCNCACGDGDPPTCGPNG